MATEPCVVCLEETALSSVLYSSRHKATRPDGSPAFMCGDCSVKSNPALRHELSEDELRRLRESAFRFGVAFGASAH